MSYWDTYRSSRIGRRRALALGGSAAIGAGLLAACGGESTDDGGQSKQVTQPEDTTAQAKRGGTQRWAIDEDTAHFDIFLQNSPLTSFKNHLHSKFLRMKPGYKGPQEFLEVEGDAAESWEYAPDLMQLTLKLRPNAKWHNKPPVNGRAFDSSDVMASWDRFRRMGLLRAAYSNEVNADAPILSMTAPDGRTIVIKLKEPTIYMLHVLANPLNGHFGLLPKEADNGYDVRRGIIGLGPYVMESYEQSSGMVWKRNPDYWEKDTPYFDTIEVPIITEYATGLSQFRAGALPYFDVRSHDILATKKDIPELLMYERPTPAAFPGSGIAFGWQPHGQSPYRDERVRQAVSMAIDRDLYLDVLGDREAYEREGFTIDTMWTSAGLRGGPFWLDPKGSEFGANAKYYKHDIAEAKRLMAAAATLTASTSFLTSGRSTGRASRKSRTT
ncbi:MAG: hypothetical protein GEU75_08125 [Dehalococcoidia bacterium]|nr:hypothetical protein [Dehalococcoidia bacterium]